AIPQRNGKGRALEGRHGDLVEDRLARKRLEIRHEGKAGRVPQEPRDHLFRIIDLVPGHRHPVRKRTHELLGQAHMTGKNNANTRAARSLKRPSHSFDDQITIFHLALDANLHIVDQQGKASWLADVLKRPWNINAEDLFHDSATRTDASIGLLRS